MKAGTVLAAAATIATVGGFVWLGMYSYQREHADPLGLLIERSVDDAQAHDAQRIGSGEPDDAPVGQPLYLTAQDAANAADDWNTMFRSCETNPECKQEKKTTKRK